MMHDTFSEKTDENRSTTRNKQDLTSTSFGALQRKIMREYHCSASEALKILAKVTQAHGGRKDEDLHGPETTRPSGL